MHSTIMTGRLVAAGMVATRIVVSVAAGLWIAAAQAEPLKSGSKPGRTPEPKSGAVASEFARCFEAFQKQTPTMPLRQLSKFCSCMVDAWWAGKNPGDVFDVCGEYSRRVATEEAVSRSPFQSQRVLATEGVLAFGGTCAKRLEEKNPKGDRKRNFATCFCIVDAMRAHGSTDPESVTGPERAACSKGP